MLLYLMYYTPLFLSIPLQYTVQQAGFDSGDGRFSSPSSLLEDPPLGEGWDENGNDLSKAANDVSTGGVHLRRNCAVQQQYCCARYFVHD